MKKYSTIGCCGIDCGLCPRFHANGVSACPGCCGKDFKEKHPSCGVVTCCVKKRLLETCADCNDFPCYRLKTENAGYDSFVTHRKIFPNLDFIKANGVELFVDLQQVRMDILTDFLQKSDDGRSKSFYCISCALLPMDTLRDLHRFMDSLDDSQDIKERCKRLKEAIQAIANDLKIELKLNKTHHAG
jgi:hypothetical protein